MCSHTNDKFDSNWEIANQYYKSMAMVQQPHQIHLNFHKDLDIEQRFVAYGCAEHLKKLKKHASSLKELDQGSETSVLAHKCMWLQKQLFDSLCSMSKDTSLLLKTVENTHLNTCNSVKAEVNKINFSNNFGACWIIEA
ncbi:midasin-like [Magnolia sinica]|uniref:midasin-like n=1 Tax=Magnolia sinica TaxID=86752 RepID=UPI00265B5656|nr:midasin-like [Magnolia sinica]XP_058090987.1 midasin-like [Magnolia sinica]